MYLHGVDVQIILLLVIVSLCIYFVIWCMCNCVHTLCLLFNFSSHLLWLIIFSSDLRFVCRRITYRCSFYFYAMLTLIGYILHVLHYRWLRYTAAWSLPIRLKRPTGVTHWHTLKKLVRETCTTYLHRIERCSILTIQPQVCNKLSVQVPGSSTCTCFSHKFLGRFGVTTSISSNIMHLLIL